MVNRVTGSFRIFGSAATTSFPSSSVSNPKNSTRLKPKSTSISKAYNTLLNNATAPSAGTQMDPVWQEVVACHLDKLAPKEKASCTPLDLDKSLDHKSLELMFGNLRSDYEKDLFHRFLSHLYPVGQQVLSFGKAVDVIVGNGSLIAGLIWGSIRILLSVSTRTIALHAKVVDQLEALAYYLPLFHRWTKLFPQSDYTDLANCIKKTCSELLEFVVEAIVFFRRSTLLNTLRIFSSSSLEIKFSTCEANIKRQTRHLDLEVNTAGLESAQKRDQSILKLLQDVELKPLVPSNSVLPFRFVQNCPRNSQFFGRDECMAELDRLSQFSISHTSQGMTNVVIHGLGGSGKSSVAKEFMYRQMGTNKYPVILWLYADTKAKLETQFIILARQLGLNDKDGNARDAVLHWINNIDENFLIVFDNVDDTSFLESCWPSSIRGFIIITSRNPSACEVNLAQHSIHMKAFGPDQGAEYLVSLLEGRHHLSSEDREAVDYLADYFGGLPLTLRQTGSFMRNKNCPPAKFRKIYGQRTEEMDEYKHGAYGATVADVWNLSSSMLSDDARILLDTLSLLDPDSIPSELFDTIDVGHVYSALLEDPLRVLDAREGLSKQSLVEHDHSSNSLSIHRLFQEITFRKLSKNEHRFRTVANFAINLLHKFSPKSDLTMVRSPSSWKKIEKTLSHIQRVYGRCKEVITEVEAQVLLKCMTEIINYGYESAQYSLGFDAFKSAQELLKKVSVPDHEVLSRMYFYQCRLCTESNFAEEAVKAILQSKEHIEIAAAKNSQLFESTLYVRILSNLGITHTAVGKFDDSERYHKQAIGACRKLAMEKECSMGNLLQNLANCYLWSGNLNKAKQVLDEALEQPNTDPEGTMYTLGNWMLKMRRYEQAVTIHREVLHRYMKQLGTAHPVTADSWHKMGCLLSDPEHMGQDLDEAERCFWQTLEIYSSPSLLQGPLAEVCVARAKWGLSTVLRQKGGGHEMEATILEEDARKILLAKFSSSIVASSDPSALFESLVFYWSK